MAKKNVDKIQLIYLGENRNSIWPQGVHQVKCLRSPGLVEISEICSEMPLHGVT